MKAPHIRIVLDRGHHRRLVDGHTIVFRTPGAAVEVILDLDRAGEPGRWTDPPEAEEYQHKRTD